jgi:hypothetical protein
MARKLSEESFDYGDPKSITAESTGDEIDLNME